jgi:hypothetical protein
MDEFKKLQDFLFSNKFEPSQIKPMSYSKGGIFVDILSKTRTIEIITTSSNQGQLINEPQVETYYFGQIKLINSDKSDYDAVCLYFNPHNLHDFLLKFSVINNDLVADFKFVKKLDDAPSISVTAKFSNDTSVLNYFLSNLYT